VRRGLPGRRVARVFRQEPASAAKCTGLLAATITGMVAIVGDADSMETFQRVRIGVTTDSCCPRKQTVEVRVRVRNWAGSSVSLSWSSVWRECQLMPDEGASATGVECLWGHDLHGEGATRQTRRSAPPLPPREHG
jgi:hypothetical protein